MPMGICWLISWRLTEQDKGHGVYPMDNFSVVRCEPRLVHRRGCLLKSLRKGFLSFRFGRLYTFLQAASKIRGMKETKLKCKACNGLILIQFG